MNFTYRRRLVVCLIFFIFYDAVVLVIVNGQPTTDDKKITENAEIAQLRAEFAHLARQLAVSVDKTANLERQLSALSATKSDRSKFNTVTDNLASSAKTQVPLLYR